MASKVFLALMALASGASAVTLTLNDYAKFADGSADNNPPTCGIPYSSLDLSKITAWSDITSDQDPQCGSCAKVCGSSGCDYLLVVDQCTLEADHLDISTLAGPQIVGSDTGNHDVSMELVDVSNCAGIWSGKMFFDWQTPNDNFKKLQGMTGGSSSSVAASSSAVAAAFHEVESSSAAAVAVQTSQAPVAYSSPAPTSSSSAVAQSEQATTPSVYPEPSSSSSLVEYVTPYPPSPSASSPCESSTVLASSVVPTSSKEISSEVSVSSHLESPTETPVTSVISEEARSSQIDYPEQTGSSAASFSSAAATPTGPVSSGSVYPTTPVSSSGFVSITASSNGTVSATSTPAPFTGAGTKSFVASTGVAVCFLATIALFI